MGVPLIREKGGVTSLRWGPRDRRRERLSPAVPPASRTLRAMRESTTLTLLILLLLGLIVGGIFLWSGPEAAPVKGDDQAWQSTERVAGSIEVGDRPSATPREAAPPAERQIPALSENQVKGRLVSGEKGLPGLELDLQFRNDQRRMQSAWTGVSDADGRFLAMDLPPRRYGLKVSGPGVPQGLEFEHFTLNPGHGFDLGDLRVPDAGALWGRVLYPDGEVASGVRVYQHYSINSLNRHFNLGADPDGEDADSSVMTDAEGKFAFANLTPGQHRVLAEVEGFVLSEVKFVVEEGVDGEMPDLLLSSGGTIQGKVFAPDGSPIPGARVVPFPFNLGTFAERMAQDCAADGRFRLAGLGPLDEVLFEAPGYVSSKSRYTNLNTYADSVLIELKPELTLHGRVEGLAGAKATVEVRPENLNVSVFPSLRKAVYIDHPVADDGTFVIEGLLERDYRITAKAEGVGKSETQNFYLSSGMEPLVLEIERRRNIKVLVRDDQGLPLEGAEVVSRGDRAYIKPHLSWPADSDRIKRFLRRSGINPAQRISTDAEGVARPLFPEKSLVVGASLDGYLPAVTSFKQGSIPDRIELVLTRAARISGQITNMAGLEKHSIYASVRPEPGQGAELPEDAELELAIDGTGRFAAGVLRPGRYEVGVRLYDLSKDEEFYKHAKVRQPLLGTGVDKRTIHLVELEGGDDVGIELELAKLGRIHGRVVAHGEPAADVILLIAESGYREEYAQLSSLLNSWDPDSSKAYDYRPHTYTDAEGRFEFLYAEPGSWTFRVQHPESVVPGKPITVVAEDYALEIERDLILESAEVRGQIDLLTLPQKYRGRTVDINLLRFDLAEDDPFYRAHHGPTAVGADINDGELAEDGGFSFKYLRAGDWILRVSHLVDGILLQRMVRTETNQVMDLGPLAISETRDLSVSAEFPGSGERPAVWLRRVYSPDLQPVFVRIIRMEEGRLKLDGVGPGEYQAELFWAYESARFSWGISGKSTEKFAEFTIHEDRSISPETLVFK